MNRRLELVAAALLGLLALVGVVLPIPAALPATPGRLTGYAFDTCHTPSQAAMDAWWTDSPYRAVAVYVSGDNRACDKEPGLTSAWVARQLRTGWRVLPVTVGRQAVCWNPASKKVSRIAADPAEATTQGKAEARAALDAVGRLGITPGSTLWLDVEGFSNTSPKTTAYADCLRSLVAFVQGWTARVKASDYLSGVYSSAASGMKALADATGAADLPDRIWIAQWNDTPTSASSYVPGQLWSGQRVHQYAGSHQETYGGITLEIDSNWVELDR